MKGNEKVISQLNKLLAGELTAIDQYFIHSRMYENWGFKELHERISHEMEDEIGHADKLIKRILFLEGIPDMSQRQELAVGRDVPEMLKNDLQLELDVIKALKEAITCCEAETDYQTREVLEELLKDTEQDHTFWLEQQLGLIDKVSLENYLQSRM